MTILPRTMNSAQALLSLERRVCERLTDELVADYHRDGAVCIRGLLSADELALLREGIEANLAQPSPRAKVASRPDDPGRFFEDFCNWQDIPQYRRFIVESPLALVAQRLMRSSTVRLYHDHLLVKEPGTRQRTPWHHDQPYYNIDGRQNVSMWIPVDPVARPSTLEFVAGSHLGPWRMPRTFMNNEAKWFPEGSLAELPDIEAAREHYPIVGWAVEPGDFVCFHMLTLHASGGVDGSNRRRVFSLRLLGDDITHAPRRWTTSPAFAGLAEQLPAGAAMNHALFPMLLG
jgi:ectoine hydroxylase-related dioxygenase (phytanoyl-CoA dioxygenase family)